MSDLQTERVDSGRERGKDRSGRRFLKHETSKASLCE